MKLVKTLSHPGGLPEILVFYCSRCKQAETKVQKRAALGLLNAASIRTIQARCFRGSLTMR